MIHTIIATIYSEGFEEEGMSINLFLQSFSNQLQITFSEQEKSGPVECLWRYHPLGGYSA
jgi:hypothetical protein